MKTKTIATHAMGICSVLSAVYAVAAPAQAQTAPNKQASQLDEIVVTARRHDESLQVTPVAATAITAQAIEQRTIQELKDFSSIAPNLHINEAQRGGSIGLVTLRGQQNINQTIANDPAVGLYFDEVYLGRSAGILTASMLDMAQVEVLRGVQGTLFGRNNTGGAILFTPVRPNLKEVEGSVKLSYGSYNRREGSLVFNAPLVQDRVGLRVALSSLQQDGTGKSVTTGIDSYGDRDRQFGRATLRVLPVDDLTVDLTYDFTRMQETGTLGASVSFPTPGLKFQESATGLTKPQVGADVDGYTVKAVYAPSKAAVAKLILGNRKLDFIGFRDVDGTAAPLADAGPTGDQEQTSAEFNISGSLGGGDLGLSGFDYVAGVFYFKESGNDNSLTPWFGVPYGAGRTIYTYGENKSFAVYAQGEAHLGNGFSAWAGARHTKDERFLSSGTYTNGTCSLLGFAPNTPPAACKLAGSKDFSYWSWSVGARYEHDNLNAYARVARGHRAGGLANIPTTVVPFDPELITEYEAGLKADWLDHRLRTNVAVFFSNYDHVQRVALRIDPASGLPYSNVFNAAKASVRGVEFESTFIATDHLRFDGAVGYIDAGYDRFTNPTPGPLFGTSAAGNKFPDTPKMSYNLSVEHSLDLAAGEVVSRLDWAWQSRTQFEVFNDPRVSQKAYGLLNARVAYKPVEIFGRAGVEFAVWGRNLTDVEYNSTGILAGPFVTVFRTDQPRTFGVDVKASF